MESSTDGSFMDLPLRARIISFSFADALGVLRAESGEELRFGASACIGFDPEAGRECWVVAVEDDPATGEPRARVVNLSGRKEPDRLTQATQRRRQEMEQRELERVLLRELGLDGLRLTPDVAATLGPERRRIAASRIIELKRRSHLFAPLFAILAELEPELFHPYLCDLDPGQELESLAFVRAPAKVLLRHIDLLRGDTPPQLVEKEGPPVSPFSDRARRELVAANPEAAALRALLRARSGPASSAVELYLERVRGRDEGACERLLSEAGFALNRHGRLVAVCAERCLELRPVSSPPRPGPYGRRRPVNALWAGEAGFSCSGCGGPLLSVLRLDAALLPGMLFPGETLHLAACPRARGPQFTRFDREGGLSPLEGFPVVPHEARPHRTDPTDVASFPALSVSSLVAVEWGRLTRMGGMPTWLDAPTLLRCPVCTEPMSYVGQVEDRERRLWRGGLLYAFRCQSCQVQAAVIQERSG